MALIPIDAIVQFHEGSGQAWIDSASPLPANSLVFDTETGDAKIGDGTKTWDQLPVSCNVWTLVDYAAALEGKAPLVHSHTANQISDLSNVLAGYAVSDHTHSIANIGTEVVNAINAKANADAVAAALDLKIDKAAIPYRGILAIQAARSGAI